MAQLPFSTLYTGISTVCKNVPNPLMKAILQEIARDFYLRSKAYVYTIAPTDVTVNVGEVTIVIDAETELVAPLEMTFEDDPLETTSLERAHQKFGRLDNAAVAGTPGFVFKSGSNALTLAPLPNKSLTGGLRGTVALRPIRGAAGIESAFMDDHGDFIVHGAIARLSAHQGHEWFSPNNAQYFTSLYESNILEAARRARNEHTPNSGLVAYGGI